MKMFKFRPRLVSGKRRSEVFWRVVVNIFIFRNSRNIYTAPFFGTFNTTIADPTMPSSFQNFRSERRARWEEKLNVVSRSVEEMCADIYAHLEGEDIYEQI